MLLQSWGLLLSLQVVMAQCRLRDLSLPSGWSVVLVAELSLGLSNVNVSHSAVQGRRQMLAI